MWTYIIIVGIMGAPKKSLFICIPHILYEEGNCEEQEIAAFSKCCIGDVPIKRISSNDNCENYLLLDIFYVLSVLHIPLVFIRTQ